MTQPPNQPPGGGFGAPQDPGRGGTPPPPPNQPPAGGPGQTPPPPAAPPSGTPGYGYPAAPGYGGQQPGQPQPGQPQPGQPQPGQPQPGQQPGPYGPPTPPSQPGPYAAPTQPAQPGPYAAPGPYNAPTQPYGAPQQPGPYNPGPGQYGYPPQPPGPGGPGAPGGGGGGFLKRKSTMIIAGVVAVLLIAGGTVWAVTGGGDSKDKPVAGHTHKSKPKHSHDPVDLGDGSGNGGGDEEDLNAGRQPGEAKVLWYKGAPDAPGNGAQAPGMWITGKTAVKAAYKQVFAYRISDGKPAYDPITFPQPICAASRTATSDNKIFVAYKESTKDTAGCNQLVQLDLDTGKQGWKKEIEDGGAFDDTLQVDLTIAGDTLMVGRSLSGVAYRTSDGKELYTKKSESGACFPGAYAGGSKLISVYSCAAGKSTAHDEVQQLDPATGKSKWTKKIPDGWKVSKVYSVDPLVLYMSNDDKNQWNISVLGATGQTTSQIVSKDSFAPECGFVVLNADLQGCTGVTADSDNLYLPTDAKSGANEIVAFSVASGKEAWRVKSPEDSSMLPIKVQDGALIAYVEPAGSGGRIVSVPLSGSHTPKTLLKNPQSAARVESGFYSRAIDYVDGRFYISTTQLTGNDDAQEKLMMAFGK